MGWYSMKYDDFCELIDAYIERVYGKGFRWTIEMTTKKDAKNKLKESLYTMFVFEEATDKLFKKSDEVPGTNKIRWSPSEALDFLLGL